MPGGIEAGPERFTLAVREITEQKIERVVGVSEKDDKGNQKVYLRTDQGEILSMPADRFGEGEVLGRRINVCYDRGPDGVVEREFAFIMQGIETVGLKVASEMEKTMWEARMGQEKELIRA